MPALSLRLTRTAFAGLLGWGVLLFVPLATAPGPAEEAAHLVLLAPLCLVPLFLTASVPDGFGVPSRWLTAASWALVPGALGAAGSAVVAPGPLAGALAGAWVAASAAVAAWALSEAWARRRALDASEAVLAVGWATLPGGAVWWFFARAGVETGYDAVVTVLTAAHFHYGGAFAAIWAGLLGRAVAEPLRRVHAALAVGLVAGFWAVAVGIALGGGPLGGSTVETAGVLALAASASGLGLLGLWQAGRFEDRSGGLMVAASGGSLALAMGLALWFHLGGALGYAPPDFGWMVSRHGWLVAFGFGLWGALGWRRLRPRPRGR